MFFSWGNSRAAPACAFLLYGGTVPVFEDFR